MGGHDPARDLNIAPYTGCFSCWVKTPGVCVLADEGREVARKAIQSHLLVPLTPITFGGYSSQLKKALDRMIPLISPFFQKIGGETHHQPRYRRYPRLLARPLVPAWLYVLIGEMGWRRLARQNGVRRMLRARPYEEAGASEYGLRSKLIRETS